MLTIILHGSHSCCTGGTGVMWLAILVALGILLCGIFQSYQPRK